MTTQLTDWAINLNTPTPNSGGALNYLVDFTNAVDSTLNKQQVPFNNISSQSQLYTQIYQSIQNWTGIYNYIQTPLTGVLPVANIIPATPIVTQPTAAQTAINTLDQWGIALEYIVNLKALGKITGNETAVVSALNKALTDGQNALTYLF